MKCCIHDFLESFIQQKIILYLQLSFIQQKIILYLQLSKSSRAFFGGAYFSAVSGWKSIPISVPGPYECLEWYRLLVFSPPTTFVLPQTVTMLLLLHWRVKWIYAWAGLTDLWDKQIHESCFCTNLFEILTEQRGRCDCLGQNKSCWLWKKQVAYSILGTHTVLGH